MRDITLSVPDDIADAFDDPAREVLYLFVPFDKGLRPDDHAGKNKLVNEATNLARDLMRRYDP